MFNQNAIILLYHDISDANSNPLVSKKIHRIKETFFYNHLQQVRKKKHFVLVDELLMRKKQGKSTKNLASLTFDDGYCSIIKSVLPILQTLEIPATLFITKSLVTKQSFWRDKVRFIITRQLENSFLDFLKNDLEVTVNISASKFYGQTKRATMINSKKLDGYLDIYFNKNNIDIASFQQNLYVTQEELAVYKYLQLGNHTANHYVLSSLSQEEQYQEISLGQTYLKGLGLPQSSFFSIPFGNRLFYNDTTLDLVRSLGYQGCLLSNGTNFSNIQYTLEKDLILLNRFMPTNHKKYYLNTFDKLKVRINNKRLNWLK